ncbi:MAG: hypothetical protein DHS20C03_03650 [Minwuia thermotolerans]|nr:MAG: hypothetical protein DHS20C03_03650 [Minwuia thermotolerans]
MEQLHVTVAIIAILIGGIQIVRRKRGSGHRLLGRAWVAAMALAAVSSFFLQSATGGFNFLHGLSVFVLANLALGVWRARRGRYTEHALFMINTWGGLVTAGWMAAARHGLELSSGIHALILAAFWAILIVATLPLHRQAVRNRERRQDLVQSSRA